MIAAVVLAAGASSRMGSSKAHLLATGTASFLDAILATLRGAGVDVVRVVMARGAATADGAVVNPDPSRGMLSSVQCGLGVLPPGVDAVLLWPVDHPLVKAATVISMIEAFRHGSHPVVVPVYEGGRGHPVLFAAALIPELLSADPAVGARAVVHAHADRLELAVPDAGVNADVDTPDDYRRVFGHDPVRTKELP